jgi:hypothetical protein
MTVVPGPHKKSFSGPIPRRTMVSLIESPKVAFVTRSEHPASSKLPASTPFWLSRLILPFIGIAIGVSLGSAAGLTLAQANAPSETVAAASDATQASPSPLAAHIGQPAADSVTKAVNVGISSAKPLAKAHAPVAAQIALNKTPDAVKPAMFKLGGKEWRVARPIAISVSQPVRQGLAGVPATAPNAMPAPHA